MNKIRVVHHSNQLGLGGTEKEIKLLCQYMNKNEFDVHVLAPQSPVPSHRVFFDRVRSLFGDSKAASRREQRRFDLIRVPELNELLGKSHVHLYTPSSLPKILESISPHILHLHHSGTLNPPWNSPETIRAVPVIFTVNVFGFQDFSPSEKRIDKILFPSQWLMENVAVWSKGDKRCGVLYCPIEKPAAPENLRELLGINWNVFVVGRIGRNADDIHDPISLRAYQRIESDRTLFLVVSAPPIMKKQANELKVRNIRFLDPSIDPQFLSRFYNTIDVLAHARLDGETFGCVIAEAMIHAKPVVTHRSSIRNAQAELVGIDCGFIVNQNDDRAYAECLKRLMGDESLRIQMGRAAEKKALENFEAGRIARNLESLYKQELGAKGIT